MLQHLHATHHPPAQRQGHGRVHHSPAFPKGKTGNRGAFQTNVRRRLDAKGWFGHPVHGRSIPHQIPPAACRGSDHHRDCSHNGRCRAGPTRGQTVGSNSLMAGSKDWDHGAASRAKRRNPVQSWSAQRCSQVARFGSISQGLNPAARLPHRQGHRG